MKRILRLFWAFLRRDFLFHWSYKIGFLYEFGSMLSGVLTLFFMGRMIGTNTPASIAAYGTDYFTFSLIGIAFVDYMFVSIRTFSQNIRIAQVLGTLEAMLATPTTPLEIVIFSATYPYVITTIRSIVVLVLGILFGANFSNINILSVIVFSLLTILVFSGLGIISAALTLYIKQAEPFSSMFAGISFLLGGILYPVQSMPECLQKAAWVLPMTHSVEGLRQALLFGSNLSSLSSHLIWLIAWSVILLPTGVFSVHFVTNWLARHGSFGEY